MVSIIAETMLSEGVVGVTIDFLTSVGNAMTGLLLRKKTGSGIFFLLIKANTLRISYFRA